MSNATIEQKLCRIRDVQTNMRLALDAIDAQVMQADDLLLVHESTGIDSLVEDDMLLCDPDVMLLIQSCVSDIDDKHTALIEAIEAYRLAE